MSIARFLALSVRWIRLLAEVAAALTFGAWSWRWSPDIWKTIDSNVIRMLRIMAHISRIPDELWLHWQVRSLCYCQTWVLLKEGSLWGTKVLYQSD